MSELPILPGCFPVRRSRDQRSRAAARLCLRRQRSDTQRAGCIAHTASAAGCCRLRRWSPTSLSGRRRSWARRLREQRARVGSPAW